MLHKSMLILAATAIVALGAVLVGCESRTTLGIEPVAACDLDLENLNGMFVAQKASPEKGEFLDKDFRINFYEEGGKKAAMSTGGRIFPQLPLTQKFSYEFREVKETASGDREAYYFSDLASLYEFNDEELAKKKKENKNLGWKLEGMLYIRLDEKRCRLKISDMYATYVEGKRIEDFNMGGQSSYVRSEEDRYSMVDCPQNYNRDKPEMNRQGELIPWEMAEPDPNRDQPYPYSAQGARVPAGKPINWMYIDVALNAKGAPEGCTYYLDAFFDDLPIEGTQNTAVTPGERWTYWRFQTTHEALEEKKFIEIHRHKVCGGKDEIIDAVCHIVETEPQEGAAEGEAAPAEG